MTTDCLYELQQSIIETLKGDAALSGMVTGIYNNIPENVKFPYVAVDNIVAFDIGTKTSGFFRVKMGIRVLSRIRGNKEVLNILAEIRRIMADATLAPTGCAAGGVREYENVITRLGDGLTWHGSINFAISLQEGEGAFIGNNGFIMKISTGEAFTTIGGVRNSSITMANNIINASSLNSGKWRKLLGESGITAVSISGNGFFANSTAEEILRNCAFSGSINNYEVIFGNNDKISGAFIVSSYKRLGNISGLDDFQVKLESAGEVVVSN